MSRTPAIRTLFVFSALYDGVLGVAFLIAAPWLFAQLHVPTPNHFGYIHFCALLLMTFAAMFLAVARDPVGNRNLIPYGIMLKTAYAGTVFFYWATSGIANAWKPFAVVDVLFIVAFVWALRAIKAAR